MPHNKLHGRMNIRTIVWPIFVEHLLRMSMMTIDVLMLSRFSDDAVAAVGLMGNLVMFLMLSFMIVSTGSAILVGQNLGAARPKQAQVYSQAGFLLSLLMGILVGCLFWFGSAPLVGLYDLEPQVAQYAYQYALVVGTFSIGMSVSILLSTVLRAYGHSKSPMLVQLLSGGVNVVGNYLALFGPFGLPVTGVLGVAWATVISQLFAVLACWWLIRGQKVPFSLRESFRFQPDRLIAILRLGLPNAGEGLSYNLAQVTIMFFVAQLGTSALTAMAIAQTLARWLFVFSLSLGQGGQILSSYMVGHNRHAELKHKIIRLCCLGMLSSFGFALLMYGMRQPLGEFFTSDFQVQSQIGALLMVSILLEPGRAINLTVISALKGAADVVFPVKVGILSMWGIGVFGAWLFGLHWSWGLVGIWLGVALDEWIRGGVMLVRWYSEKWTRFSLVSETDTETADPVSQGQAG